MMDLPEIPDQYRSLLFDYQIEPTRQLLRALLNGPQEWGYPGAVDLSDVGVGKSYMDFLACLLFCQMTGRSRIIVLTVSVGLNGWEKTAKHFGAEKYVDFIGTYEALRGNWRPHIAKLEGSFYRWTDPDKTVVILDEAQKIKGDMSMITALIGGAVLQRIPMLAASATLASKPTELRIGGRITGLHKGGRDWKEWLVKCGARWIEVDKRWAWEKNTAVLDGINRILIPSRGCRVRKEDIGNLPKTTISLLGLLPPESAELQEEFENLAEKVASMRKARDDYGRPKFGREQITNYQRGKKTKLWQKAELALVPMVAELVKACLDEGKSVILFFSFTASRLAMGKLLKTKDGFFGGQSKNQRSKLEEAFQAGRIRVLLCNIGAAGASLSLQDKKGDRPRETFIFTTDNPVKLGQAPGRVHRAGGQSESQQWIVFIKGGFIEAMIRKTLERLDNIRIINDGADNRLL